MRKISDNIFTCAYSDIDHINNAYYIIDVRGLRDCTGNMQNTILTILNKAHKAILDGHKVLIACDFGVSRSNSIAIGVLSIERNIPFCEALDQVLDIIDENEIKITMLEQVRVVIDSNKETNLAGNALLLGGSGFIGSKLSEKAKQCCSYNIYTPSHEELDVSLSAIPLYQYCIKNNIRVILDFANTSNYTDNSALGQSIGMLKNILSVCSELSIKLLYPSTHEVFSGNTKAFSDFTEEAEPNVYGTYGETKLLSEKLINIHIENYNLNCAIIRFGSIYCQENLKRPAFINNFLQKALRNVDIEVHEYLNGAPYIDLIHINDCVNFIFEFLKRFQPGIFHVGSSNYVTTHDIAEYFINKCQSTSKIVKNKIDRLAPNVKLSNSKVSQLFKWKPHVDIYCGLDLYCNGLNNFGEKYEK